MTRASSLRARIAADYGVRLDATDNASAFAETVARWRRVFTARGVSLDGLPLFGAHINPDLSCIAPDCFRALVSSDEDGLTTTNTARLYRFDGKKTIRWLMESCRLWYDQPDLHAPLMTCDVTSDDPRMDREVEAAIHVGTAWVHPSMRGRGLGRLMVALHRIEAFEHLPAPLMFGTTVAAKDGGWTGGRTFHGVAVVHMGAKDDPLVVPEVQQVRIYTAEDVAEVAKGV